MGAFLCVGLATWHDFGSSSKITLNHLYFVFFFRYLQEISDESFPFKSIIIILTAHMLTYYVIGLNDTSFNKDLISLKLISIFLK